jgi:beta-lactamase class A
MTSFFITRRVALAGVAGAMAAPAFGAARDPWGERLAAIERKLVGRIGVLALDTGNGRAIGRRADERFPMCSTFKWMLAAAVLARVDAGRERLERPIRYSAADLLSNAPVAKANLAKGELGVEALCAAAVEVSDNTAANLLLASLGGPAGLTRWLRSIGDDVTRLDRNEPTLNTAIPGDPRDTTTPRAEVATLRKVLLGPVLKPASRERLLGWMKASTTGLKRLRAGLPRDWTAGDKTGTSFEDRGVANDEAIAWPPGRAPVLIAAFVVAPSAKHEAREAAIADIARVVAEWAST